MMTEYRRRREAEVERMRKQALKNRNRKGLDSNLSLIHI